MSTPIVKLWSDQSTDLRRRLEAGGYQVQALFTGSENPVIAYGDTWISGYTEIVVLLGV